MPVIIKCKNCGAIYHYGLSPVSVKPLIESLNYCRYCGSPITKDIKKIRVTVKGLPDSLSSE